MRRSRAESWQSIVRDARPALLVTGHRKHRRHIIRVLGVEVELTWGPFRALCALAAACIAGTGPVKLDRMTVRRLRNAIGVGTGQDRLGDELIDVLPKSAYFLLLDAHAVAVDESFEHVILNGGIDAAVATILRSKYLRS